MPSSQRKHKRVNSRRGRQTVASLRKRYQRRVSSMKRNRAMVRSRGAARLSLQELRALNTDTGLSVQQIREQQLPNPHTTDEEEEEGANIETLYTNCSIKTYKKNLWARCSLNQSTELLKRILTSAESMVGLSKRKILLVFEWVTSASELKKKTDGSGRPIMCTPANTTGDFVSSQTIQINKYSALDASGMTSIKATDFEACHKKKRKMLIY